MVALFYGHSSGQLGTRSLPGDRYAPMLAETPQSKMPISVYRPAPN